MITLYIDADACPVKEEAIRIAKRYSVKSVLVANFKVRIPEEELVQTVAVPKGFDAGDNWIVEQVKLHDIVLTNDVLLSEKVVKKGAISIDPRGKVLDEDSIGEAVATRELMYDLRQQGALNLGPKKMGKNHLSTFLSSMDTLMNKQLKKVKG